MHGHWVGFPQDDRKITEILQLTSLPQWGQYAGVLIFFNVAAQEFALIFAIWVKQWALVFFLFRYKQLENSVEDPAAKQFYTGSTSDLSSHINSQ